MNARRALSLAFALLATAALVAGTGGFSAMQAEREVSIEVVGDGSAYLGYEPLTTTVDVNGSTDVVAFHNRLNADLTLDVVIHTDGSRLTSETAMLGEGERETISIAPDCTHGESVRLRFVAIGEWPGVVASLERHLTVVCESSGQTNQSASLGAPPVRVSA